MTRILDGLSGITSRYDVLLVDLWGCYHDGLTPFPAAVEACRGARAAGQTVVLLTNAPRPSSSVRRFLDRIGAPDDSWDAIVSSGEACQSGLASGRYGWRIHYLGPERDLHMLTETGLAPHAPENADAVLCTGLENDAVETPEDYAERLAHFAGLGLPMLCANPDIQVDRGEERLWCAGALARDYTALGAEVVYFGKPHAPIYEKALSVAAELRGGWIDRSRVLAIGDGINTDVKGAVEAGLDSVFITGGLAAPELGPDPENPDPVLLDGYLVRHGLSPAYAIGRMRWGNGAAGTIAA